MIFGGAKLALFLGARILVIQRDDKTTIPYPGHWDFPGGGRDGNESPEACVLRETWEETGLHLTPDHLVGARFYDQPTGPAWFFAAHLAPSRAREVRLGDEGQGWRLMTPTEYCAHPLCIPQFADRLRHYLEDADF